MSYLRSWGAIVRLGV